MSTAISSLSKVKLALELSPIGGKELTAYLSVTIHDFRKRNFERRRHLPLPLLQLELWVVHHRLIGFGSVHNKGEN